MEKPDQSDIRQQHMILPSENAVIKDMVKMTTHFDRMQNLLSLERMPTVCYVLPAYESLIVQLDQSKQKASGRPIAHAYNAAIDKIQKYQAKCRENPIYGVSMGRSNTIYDYRHSHLQQH
jgi:allophanate hydrolase subunit 1